jgi:hypothetical protein
MILRTAKLIKFPPAHEDNLMQLDKYFCLNSIFVLWISVPGNS